MREPMCGGPGRTQGWRAWGGGARLKHVAHVRDAGRVEAERLVERRRTLPSRKEGICHAGRGAAG